jgi:hypothetical protein
VYGIGAHSVAEKPASTAVLCLRVVYARANRLVSVRACELHVTVLPLGKVGARRRRGEDTKGHLYDSEYMNVHRRMPKQCTVVMIGVFALREASVPQIGFSQLLRYCIAQK